MAVLPVADPGIRLRSFRTTGESEVPHEAKKPVDRSRLTADLTAASVELLSAQCAVDRVRLRYSVPDIVACADRQTLKQAIASTEALFRFFSQLGAQIKTDESSGRGEL